MRQFHSNILRSAITLLIFIANLSLFAQPYCIKAIEFEDMVYWAKQSGNELYSLTKENRVITSHSIAAKTLNINRVVFDTDGERFLIATLRDGGWMNIYSAYYAPLKMPILQEPEAPPNVRYQIWPLNNFDLLLRSNFDGGVSRGYEMADWGIVAISSNQFAVYQRTYTNQIVVWLHTADLDKHQTFDTSQLKLMRKNQNWHRLASFSLKTSGTCNLIYCAGTLRILNDQYLAVVAPQQAEEPDVPIHGDAITVNAQFLNDFIGKPQGLDWEVITEGIMPHVILFNRDDKSLSFLDADLELITEYLNEKSISVGKNKLATSRTLFMQQIDVDARN